MAKKGSAAKAAARGTKKDPNKVERKENVKKELKHDGHGILLYVVATVVIIGFLYLLHVFGIA